ncbi:MAG: protease HtpX [Epsilonproteobacteria bacterium]|nr:protease HtpX [Campylobacterota bacterium]NPA89341.1 protease HtpX [Campylobacterota bacterium]
MGFGILLFILANLGVMASVYLTIFLLELIFHIHINPGETWGLAIFAALFGMGGALFSLFTSKWMAIRGMGVRLIESPSNEGERWLVETVHKLADEAGIGRPDVGVFDGPPNAFATGWNRNEGLVAVSTSLFDLMEPKEIEGVLAHEISHLKNGDMITMTLLQGILNTLVIFLARIVAGIFTGGGDDDEKNEGGIAYFLVSLVLEMVFSLFATMIAMWFSRYREFRADEGAVLLSGPEGIYYALAKLGNLPREQVALPADMKAFGIVGFLEMLFASHPPIEERLENIRRFAQEQGYPI